MKSKISEELRKKLIEVTLIFANKKTFNGNRRVHNSIKVFQLIQTISIFFSEKVKTQNPNES